MPIETGDYIFVRSSGTWIEETMKKRLRWDWSSTAEWEEPDVDDAGVDVHIVAELRDKSPHEIRTMAARIDDVVRCTLGDMHRALMEAAGDEIRDRGRPGTAIPVYISGDWPEVFGPLEPRMALWDIRARFTSEELMFIAANPEVVKLALVGLATPKN